MLYSVATSQKSLECAKRNCIALELAVMSIREATVEPTYCPSKSLGGGHVRLRECIAVA